MISPQPLLLAAVTMLGLAGCVYGPPFYDEPFSPYPWRYREEPDFLWDGRYPRHYAPHTQRRRYRDYDRYEERELENRPTDQDRPAQEEKVIPPSGVDVPGPPSAPTPTQPPVAKDVPTATKGSKPGRVKVPFPPYNELDVSGLPPGSLAKDPTTGKVFRLP